MCFLSPQEIRDEQPELVTESPSSHEPASPSPTVNEADNEV